MNDNEDQVPSEEAISKKEALKGLFLTIRSIEGGDRRREAASKVPLELVFGCLGSDDEETLHFATQLLEDILQYIPLGILLESYSNALLGGLSHPTERITLLAISQLKRFSTATGEDIESLRSRGLFEKMISLLASPSALVATATADFFVKLAATEPGKRLVFSQDAIQEIKGLLDDSPTTRFRVSALFIRLSEISPEISQLCKVSGILSTLTEDLSSEDSLVKLNAIELCSELLSKTGSAKLLEDIGVFQSLAQNLNAAGKGKLDLANAMGAAKTLILFSEVSKAKDVDFPTFGKAHDLFNALRAAMYNDECNEVQESAVLAVGVIGSTRAGLQLLETVAVEAGGKGRSAKKRKSLVPETSLLFYLVDLFNRDPHARDDLKIALLQSLTLIFEVKPEDESSQHKGLEERFFESLEMSYDEDKRPTDHPLLLRLVKVPKELVRYAGYGLLQALVIHGWGKRKVVSTPGLLDHLLDRSTEGEKLGKEWKFAIIQGLGARINLHHEVLVRIQQYISQGPFFAGSDVAVEGLHM